MTQDEIEKSKYSAQSLIRGLEILNLFNSEQRSLSLSEISKLLNVNRTIPFRLLFTLQSEGYLVQDEQTKCYSLTPKVLDLGFSYLSSLELPNIAQPYLDNLKEELGFSCYLSIIDGKDVVYIATAPIKGVSFVNVNIGTRLPAHVLANGKVLLTFQPDLIKENSLKIIRSESYTYINQKDFSNFLSELDNIKKQGYALSKGEFLPGISSVAVPIFNHTKSIVACLNVVFSESMVNQDFINNIALEKLKSVAKMLSSHLGYKE